MSDKHTPSTAHLARTPARKKFLHDVFVTALEGGIGYWSVCTRYKWRRPDVTADTPFDQECDLDGFHAVINDAEGDDFKGLVIDGDVIERGLALIKSGEVKLSDASRANIMLADHTNLEAGDLDADDADVIVQAGLFNEVVYG